MLPLPRLAVLISGAGTNLKAIAAAIDRGDLSARIEIVISSNSTAPGLLFARQRGIKTRVLTAVQYPNKTDYDEALRQELLACEPTWVVLAGFMRILTPCVVDAFWGRIVNIHPSLLPKYPGLHTHQRALNAQDKHHGCTVHWVTRELDAGPIIAQSSLEIQKEDTAQTLKKRVQQLEYRLYWRALYYLLTGRTADKDDQDCFFQAPLMESNPIIPNAE